MFVGRWCLCGFHGPSPGSGIKLPMAGGPLPVAEGLDDHCVRDARWGRRDPLAPPIQRTAGSELPASVTMVPRLELEHVTKRYANVVANDDVALSVQPGEIHSILGENGAGKSTLVKVIYGAVRPDAGELRWDGSPVRIHSPQDARGLGIAMVFQHFALLDPLTVAENVWLGLGREVKLRS